MSEEQQTLETFNSDSRTKWVMKELGDVAHINLGQSPKSEYYNDEGDGPYFLQGSKNFGNKYPELERFCSKPKREAEEGDVLISVRAPVGPVNVAPERVCIGRGVTGIRMNEGDNDYLYYFLKHFNDGNKWSQYEGGTTFNSINKTDLQNLEIPYPHVEERNKIASILRNFDKKIETNNRINELLEEIAQTLYRSWFVNFEPYDEFKDSELGRIPTEFKIKTVSDFAEIILGNSPKSEYYNEQGEGLPFFQGSKNFGLRYPEIERWCTKKKKVAIEGDVLISIRAPVGDINRTMVKCVVGRGVTALRMKEHTNEFLYHLLKANSQNWEKYKSGTTFNSINKTDIQNFPVALPPEKDIEKFNSIVRPMADRFKNNVIENNYLADLRDILLPKLMSGDIRLEPGTNNQPASDD